MRTTCINERCSYLPKNQCKVGFVQKIFSSVFSLSLEYLRLAGSSAVFAQARLAQTAGELIVHKNHIKERNIFIKQILHWSLCIMNNFYL